MFFCSSKNKIYKLSDFFKQKNKLTKIIQMETLEQIKSLVEELSVDTTKFFGGNNSAGTRARKSAQDLKKLLDSLRKEILAERKGGE